MTQRTFSRRLDLHVDTAVPHEGQSLVEVLDLVHAKLGSTVVLFYSIVPTIAIMQ